MVKYGPQERECNLLAFFLHFVNGLFQVVSCYFKWRSNLASFLQVIVILCLAMPAQICVFMELFWVMGVLYDVTGNGKGCVQCHYEPNAYFCV